MQKLVILNIGERTNEANQAIECLSSMDSIKNYNILLCSSERTKDLVSVAKYFYGVVKVIVVSFNLWRLENILNIKSFDEVYVVDISVESKKKFTIKDMMIFFKDKRSSFQLNDQFLKLSVGKNWSESIGGFSKLHLFELIDGYKKSEKKITEPKIEAIKVSFLNEYVGREIEIIEKVIGDKWEYFDNIERKVANRLKVDAINSK